MAVPVYIATNSVAGFPHQRLILKQKCPSCNMKALAFPEFFREEWDRAEGREMTPPVESLSSSFAFKDVTNDNLPFQFNV